MSILCHLPQSRISLWKSVSLLLRTVSCLVTADPELQGFIWHTHPYSRTHTSARTVNNTLDVPCTHWGYICLCVYMCASLLPPHKKQTYVSKNTHKHTHSCALHLLCLNISGGDLSSPVSPKGELWAPAICRLSLSITFQSSFHSDTHKPECGRDNSLKTFRSTWVIWLQSNSWLCDDRVCMFGGLAWHVLDPSLPYIL